MEETPKAGVGRLFREALEQNPGGMPFLIFIDLNLPLTPGVPTRDKPWFNELKELFDQLESGTPDQPEEFTGVIFTNFGWHYYREKGAPGGEYVIVTSRNPCFPVGSETWALLKRALDEYGFIPDEEQHEKKVRARYPRIQATFTNPLHSVVTTLPVHVCRAGGADTIQDGKKAGRPPPRARSIIDLCALAPSESDPNQEGT